MPSSNEAHAEEIHAREQGAGRLDVDVGIVEPGEHMGAAEVDGASAGAGVPADLRVGAHRDDPFTVHGDRLGAGEGAVQGVHAAVHQDEVSRVSRRTASRPETEQQTAPATHRELPTMRASTRRATAPNVVCAALKPSRKSASEKLTNRSVG